MSDIEMVTETDNKELIEIEGQALAIRVIDAETYAQAGEIFNLIIAWEKKTKERWDPLCRKADEAHKALTAERAKELAKVKPLKEYINKEQTTWNLEQERKRKEKEEQLRIETLKREEEERLKAALQAEAEGNKAEAEAILEEPVFVPTPIVEKTVPKVAGQTMTTTWRWRILDERLIPREYLIVDEMKINGVVRALHGKTNIPGIEPYAYYSMKGVRK